MSVGAEVAATLAALDLGARYQYGTVTSATSPPTVRLDSETTGVPTVAMMPVTLDDRVLVFLQGADRIVVGTVAPSIALAGRNKLDNCAMQIAQRSSSVAGVNTGGYYTADRWFTNIVSLGTWTQSVETDAPAGTGLSKSLKMLCTTADAAPSAADLVNVQQLIEGQNLQDFLKGTASARPGALQFWVKSNKTGTYIVELRDTDNTRICCASYTITASATWERKTIVFPADVTGALTNDANESLRVLFWLAAGSNFTTGALATAWAASTDANRAVGQTNLASATTQYWQITGTQLEVGAAVTPLEVKTHGDELFRCQRYCHRIGPGQTNQTIAFGGQAYNATTGVVYMTLPRSMRANPALTVSAVTDFNVTAANSAATATTNLTVGTFTTTGVIQGLNWTVAAGMVAGNSTSMSPNVNGWLMLSADL